MKPSPNRRKFLKTLDWLERGHTSSRNKEDDRIDGGRRDTVPTDRVSVIGDIDVPDSVVEALPKGPLSRSLRKTSYMIDCRQK